jgi:hypothetical protein
MEEQRAPGVGKIAIKYGVIQGVLGFLLFVIVAMTGLKQNWMTSSVSIVVLVVLMILAHREFKKTHENMMTYGQGVGSGTLLSVVASVVSAVLLYIYVGFINTGYPAAALKIQRAAMEERGISGPQLDQAMAMTSAMLTPVGIVITSLISGIIVGFIASLIVSAFTRARDPRAVY